MQTVKREGCQCCQTQVTKQYTLKLLALIGDHHILHVSRVRVKELLYKAFLRTECTKKHVQLKVQQAVCVQPLRLYNFLIRIEVNQSRYRPGVAQRVLRELRFPDFMTTAQDGGKVVSPTHRPPLPTENTPGTHVFFKRDVTFEDACSPDSMICTRGCNYSFMYC